MAARNLHFLAASSNESSPNESMELALSVDKATKSAAFAYLRVSSRGQVDGDGFPRQMAAVSAYAKAHGITVSSPHVYREEGVCGATELENRPALARLLEAVSHGSVRMVLIERLDRLARDLMVQETIIADLRRRGVEVVSTCEPDLCSDDPSRKLMRQIMGAIAEYDKKMVVSKLRVARERMKAKSGHCEGRKPFGHYPGEHETLLVMLSMQGDATLQAIADELSRMGRRPRSGERWHPKTISRILARSGQKQSVDESHRLASLRAQGASWATICSEVGVSEGTARRAFYALPKTPAASVALSA